MAEPRGYREELEILKERNEKMFGDKYILTQQEAAQLCSCSVNYLRKNGIVPPITLSKIARFVCSV